MITLFVITGICNLRLRSSFPIIIISIDLDILPTWIPPVVSVVASSVISPVVLALLLCSDVVSVIVALLSSDSVPDISVVLSSVLSAVVSSLTASVTPCSVVPGTVVSFFQFQLYLRSSEFLPLSPSL